MLDYIDVMNQIKQILAKSLVISIFLMPIWLGAQDPSSILGYVDENNDGINDRFCDANGDGVNDVDQQAYTHSFKYQDRDGNGINDLWVDADGDGVNDLLHEIGKTQSRWVDLDADGIQDQQAMELRGRALWPMSSTPMVTDETTSPENPIRAGTCTGIDTAVWMKKTV